MNFTATFIFSLLLSLPTQVASQESLTWNVLDEHLPTGLSDLTATLDPSNGIVFIAGGCDSEKGNEYLADLGLFVCGSITNTFYSFDIESYSFSKLQSLPRARYRHGAAIVNGQIWLVGGRDAQDQLIAQVDVYDIANNTWSTPGSLKEEFQTSDEGVFSDDSYVYVVGGYDANYTSYNTTFRIDAAASTSDLVIDKVASIHQPRGDVSAVHDGQYGYVAGGFTHTNNFCNALDSVERYDIANDMWETIAPLQTPRADMALLVMNGKLFAVGGERQIENICEIAEGDLPAVGEQTIPVDNVEVLESDDGSWKFLASLPDYRFRFAAVGWEETSTIYTFGGQAAYNNSCLCFATTDEVVAYVDMPNSSGATKKAMTFQVGLVVAVVAGLAIFT